MRFPICTKMCAMINHERPTLYKLIWNKQSYAILRACAVSPHAANLAHVAKTAPSHAVTPKPSCTAIGALDLSKIVLHKLLGIHQNSGHVESLHFLPFLCNSLSNFLERSACPTPNVAKRIVHHVIGGFTTVAFAILAALSIILFASLALGALVPLAFLALGCLGIL